MHHIGLLPIVVVHFIARCAPTGFAPWTALANQIMLSLMMGQGSKGVDTADVLKYHSDEGYAENPRCRVQIDSSRLGFLR